MEVENVVIMASEPCPNVTPEDIRSQFHGCLSEQNLADAFAICSNKFWWVEDNVYDYEEGTPEHKQAQAITDEWCELMEHYEEQIFCILRSEGVEIPDTGRIAVLIPFMERNGYYDSNGWWMIKEKETTKMQETRVRQKPNPEKMAYRKAVLKEPYPMNLLLTLNDGFFHFEPLANEDIKQDNIDGLLHAVSFLPGRTQEMIRLRFEERQTFKKIGETIGITTERVRYLLVDAERKLRSPRLYGYIKYGKVGREVRRAQLEEEKKNAVVDKMQIDVRDMGLSVKAMNRLIAKRCDVVADVVALKKDEILNIKMLGKTMRQEIASKLESLGITDSDWSKF